MRVFAAVDGTQKHQEVPMFCWFDYTEELKAKVESLWALAKEHDLSEVRVAWPVWWENNDGNYPRASGAHRIDLSELVLTPFGPSIEFCFRGSDEWGYDVTSESLTFGMIDGGTLVKLGDGEQVSVVGWLMDQDNTIVANIEAELEAMKEPA